MEEIKKIEVAGQQYGVADMLMRSVMGGKAQVIEWSHTHNMNDYKDAGTYRIKGERTGNPMSDNLPIMNQGSGHTIEGILYVLDSSLTNGSGNSDDCTITQFLILSNRVGGQEGDMYMRSGYGANKDALTWKPWEKYQTNMEVGVVCDTDTHSMQDFNQIIVPNRGLNDFIDNGIYSGVYLPANAATFYDYETFVMLTINNYALAGNSRTIVQVKFATTVNGAFSMQVRELQGSGTFSGWESIVGGSDSATEVIWDSNSNMNNYTTPGIYSIYGERTKHDDNLPITNANSGHSIAGRLTVLASTLQPANNEVCVTQILMLSNRRGGDGNMYIRTYNQNNSPFTNGWSIWKKLSGVEEGYIFTNTKKLNQDFGLQTKGVGLNYMVDNGNYSGVYVNEEAIVQKGSLDANGNGVGSFNTNISQVRFVETFNITVINDYAVAGQVNNLLDSLGMSDLKKQRQICQIKTATDYFTGTTTIKKRTCLGNGDEYKVASNWGEWEEIGGKNYLGVTTSSQIAKDVTLKSGTYYGIASNLDNCPFALEVSNNYDYNPSMAETDKKGFKILRCYPPYNESGFTDSATPTEYTTIGYYSDGQQKFWYGNFVQTNTQVVKYTFLPLKSTTHQTMVWGSQRLLEDLETAEIPEKGAKIYNHIIEKAKTLKVEHITIHATPSQCWSGGGGLNGFSIVEVLYADSASALADSVPVCYERLMYNADSNKGYLIQTITEFEELQ